MFCTSCGSIVKRRAVLCMSCGVRVTSVTFPEALPQVVESGQGVAPQRNREGAKLPPYLAVPLAMAGGALGIVAAIQAELPASISLVGPTIWAAAIEEIFKPLGVYLLLIRWPASFKGQLHIALFTALAGLTFGLVESGVYVLRRPDAGPSYVLFRFTVPVAIHVLASFVFALGLNRQLFAALASGKGVSPRSWPFLLAGVTIHSLYNAVVTLVEIIKAF